MKPVSRISLLIAGLITSTAYAAPKNILFIAVDDLKPALGAYGDPVAVTPNIDKLASRGLLFENAYTNQALCSPSRNSLLVGVRPSTLGIYNLDVNFREAAPDAVTLPQALIKQGYRTEAIGKLFHVGQGNRDDTASWSVPHTRPNAPTFALTENQAGPDQRAAARATGRERRGAAYEAGDVADDFYIDGKIAAETIGRLEAAKNRPDTPFFIAAGFIRPHLPFVSPKKYWDLYDPSKLKLAAFRQAPEGAPAQAIRKNGELSSYKTLPDADNLSEEEQLKLLHAYYAAASYTDAQIGKLIDALDRLELTDDTIIVLWGDHGWHLGDHGLWGKMTNFEQATRIPLIISAPGVTKPGSKTKALAESVDIYPTLLDLTETPTPDTKPKLEGKSLLPVLKDPSTKIHESVIQVLPRNGFIGRAIRTSTHRLVEWKKPGASADTAEYEVYDYSADAEERKNIAGEAPEVLDSLKKELAKYPEAKPQISVTTKTPEGSGQTLDRERLFTVRDKNSDGKLTKEEFLANQRNQEAALARWTKFDKNGDGILTKEEFISAGN